MLSAGRELTRLELMTEAVRAVLEHLATAAPQVLDELVTAEWSERYGRQVRMCSRPSHPVARLTQVGTDADVLLERVYGGFGEQVPPQADVLRRLLIQNFWTDARARLRPRTEREGLPPSRIRIQSPYETEARWVRRGDTRWTGYLLHVTETCDAARVNIVTDVATWVSEADSQALPGIHARLKKRRALPAEHLVDGGYASGAALADADRKYKIALVGPIGKNSSKQAKANDGFAKQNFIIDFDRREVTCPNGKVSGNRNETPAMAPYTVVRFGKRQCGPRPEKAKCTTGEARTINFLPRRVHELQERNRDDQQDSAGRRLYALRSGAEGTIAEFTDGHRARHCRYHGMAKTHVQHVLTAIAVNIERLSQQEPADTDYRPRPPTAFQQYLDAHDLPRPIWWRQGK